MHMQPSEQNQAHVIGLVDDVILGLFFVPGFDRDPSDAQAPAWFWHTPSARCAPERSCGHTVTS